MDNYELLVHVAAPSGFHDDKRYIAQAQSILKFQAAAVTKVYQRGIEEDVQIAERPQVESRDKSFKVSFGSCSEIVKETLAQSRARDILWKSRLSGAADAPPGSSPASWKVRKEQRRRPFSANPPYKNPLQDRPPPLQPSIQALRTPDFPRPKTAPAGDGRRPENSFYVSTGRKRASSDSSSFESLMSGVFDSQPERKATPAGNSGQPPAHHISSATSVGQHEQNSQDLAGHSRLSGNAPAKRRRLSHIRISANGRTVRHPPSNQKGRSPPFFLQDHSLDWTSSSAPYSSDAGSSSTSLTATATPSQPLRISPGIISWQQTPRRLPAFPNPSSPINLLSQDFPSSPQAFPQISSPPAPRSTHADPGTSSYPLISALPDHIFPPSPPTGHSAFETHITSHLHYIVSRLPLIKTFRPVYVSRDVGVLERGYWRLPIIIAREEAVAEARKEPSKEEKMAMMDMQLAAPTYAETMKKFDRMRAQQEEEGFSDLEEDAEQEKKKRHDLWTEKEFLDFWGKLKKLISSGEAGWGVRVFRPEVENGEEGLHHDKGANSQQENSERPNEVQVVLRITTWGEVIPHIWLLLWLYSDKLTSYIPMEWRAADESVVVRMSGYRRKHGILGEWKYKGPAGEKGLWGIGGAEEAELGPKS